MEETEKNTPEEQAESAEEKPEEKREALFINFLLSEDVKEMAENLEEKFTAEFVVDRSSEVQPSVEIHPEYIYKVILFLKGVPMKVDFLDSITAVDLMNYNGPELDRTTVPWSSLYPEPVKEPEKTEGEEKSDSEVKGPRLFMVVYHLFSFPSRKAFVLKTILPENKLQVDTIDGLFGNANWLEREVHELFGIDFQNSRDMRNLMLPEDWEGHPLRKDYVQGSSYNDMSTSRVDPLVELKEKALKMKS